MKHTTTMPLALLFFLAAGFALRAAPLAGDAIIYSSPETTARITGTLAAGTEPPPVTSPLAVALPEGWQAVERADSLECWVRDNDLNKELNIKPGALLHAAPSAESPVIGTMAAGDLSELTDIQGRWAQMHYTKRTLGYIQTGTAGGATAATVTVARTSVPAQETSTPAPSSEPKPAQPQSQPQLQPQPQPQTTATTTTIVTTTAVRDGTPTPMPRSFEGTFAITRRVFGMRRPYDYQLNDSTGERFAYLDLSAVTTNQRPEIYQGRTVIIYGAMQPVPGSKDIVIRVETLQVK
jgi:hypothetical protein